MATSVTASTEWKVEEAARLWLIDDIAGYTHALTIGADVRHFEEDYRSEDNLDGSDRVPELIVPALILKACRIRQLSPAFAPALYRLETELWAKPDDTTLAEYQAMSQAREYILMRQDLKTILSAALDDFACLAVQQFQTSEKRVVKRHWASRMDVLLWAQGVGETV